MAKMKTLMTTVLDYEDEINKALDKAQKVAPAACALIWDTTISETLNRKFWQEFAKDENVVTLILGCIQMQLITKAGKVNTKMLTAALNETQG